MSRVLVQLRRKKARVTRERAQLALEPLETRDLLATAFLLHAAAPVTDALDEDWLTSQAANVRIAWNLFSSLGRDDDPVADEGPAISEFQAIQMDEDTWMIQGQVSGTDVEGLVVNIGGDLPPLQGGKSTSVGSDGWFHLQITLGSNDSGTVTAQTTDRAGHPSNLAQALVR
jgi:hypothetical protein